MTKRLHLRRQLLVVALLPLLSFGYIAPARAIDIQDAAVEVRNDFVLEPAKTEIFLKPGEKAVRSLSVVNRTDREQTYTVSVEDFTGSKDPNQVVVLLGNDKSPYSLKDFIKPEVNTFTLKSKQRAVMQVTISIPADAEPGGRYGSVLVSAAPKDNPDNTDNQTRTISRVGSLYFVRVAGHVNEDAKLSDFRLEGGRSIREQGPFNFEMLFENNSSVHLTPSGTVTIKNILGREVKKIDIAPFFSLPNSLRSAKVTWDPGWAIGRYTATAVIDRGYKENPDVTDTKTIAFWVLPWKIVVGFIIILLAVIFILRRITTSFQITRKR